MLKQAALICLAGFFAGIAIGCRIFVKAIEEGLDEVGCL